jgi:hypothetical protein
MQSGEILAGGIPGGAVAGRDEVMQDLARVEVQWRLSGGEDQCLR